MKNELDSILDGIDKTETEYENGWWETSTGAEFGAKKKADILAWHNTQLKAAIPEKRRTEPDHTEHQLPSDVLQRWQSRQMAYNQAIDDMQSKLGQTEKD